MIGRTWSGLPDSLQHLSSRWLLDPLITARISTEAPILPRPRLTTLSHFPKETSKVLIKNHVQAKMFHLETELPARLEAPMSLKVSSPTWQNISNCTNPRQQYCHQIKHLQLLLWRKGGVGRHLQTIRRLMFFLNIKRLNPLLDHRGADTYVCPTTSTPYAITEVLAPN